MKMKPDDRCVSCNGIIKTVFAPMKQWKIEGRLCGECYSKKISEFYPGEHVRVDSTDL
jgi:hypothetical protein|tara:strand:- start:158 stop:331 length:174 start_codon:yes stop_codon:yes gene_type:complete